MGRAAALTLKSAQAAAARGDAEAQFYLSRCYAWGKGVPQDNDQAIKYLRQSANQGYAPAEHNLGAFYFSGLLGLPQSDTEAVKWFRQAAAQGNPLAEFSLGLAYQLGRGVTTNLLEAVSWYKKAAKQNQTNALLALGSLYLGGQGIEDDFASARDCFKQAAACGSVTALNSLGYVYEQGWAGVAPDPKRARKYYLQAAERNFPKAQMNLGRLYMDGIGVKPDLIEAYKWFVLASRNGGGMGRRYMMELDGRMSFGDFTGNPLSPEQVQEALRRAKAFGKKPPTKITK